MTDFVECAECATRYDSETNAFCPRCGSTAKGTPAAPAIASARNAHPRRRRAQVGGVILLVLGVLFAAQFLYALLVTPDLSDDAYAGLADVPFLATQGGGSVHLRILDNGTPVAGLTVFVRPLESNATNEVVTSPSGWANFTAPAALTNATFSVANESWNNLMYIPTGERHTLVVDTADPHGESWSGVTPSGPLRAVAGFFAGVSLYIALGGFLAIKLRAFPVAISAGFVALLPTLFAAVTSGILGLLNLVAVIAAIAFIIRGRSFFAKKAGAAEAKPPEKSPPQ